MQAALAKGDDRSRWDCLRIASRMDPARVLELLEKHPFQNPGMDASIRKMVATEILATDPLAAESIVKAIPNPKNRAWAYVELAAALPDDQRDLGSASSSSSPRSEAHAPPVAARGRP